MAFDEYPFDRREAARRLGISVVTLDRKVAERLIPHFRVGRRVLFTQPLLDRYIRDNTVEMATQDAQCLTP